MSIRSALTPVFRPFASVLIADRGWAKLADVGYAGVIVGAAGALFTGGALVHGRWQTALLVVGSVLVLVALFLATLAILRKAPEPVETQGKESSDDWNTSLEESDRTNRELEELFKSKRQPSSGSTGP